MSKYQILTLGSSPPRLKLALEAIAPQGFDITETPSPDAWLSHAHEQNVDLALVQLVQDTSQLKLLCEQLGHNKKRNIPVIVCTNTDDIEQTLASFEAGAFDVMSPSCPERHLEKRLKVALEWHDKEVMLEAKLKRAKETAFCAMEDSNDLGQVITFLNETINCVNYSDLAEQCFSTFQALDVSGSIVFHSKHAEMYFSDDQSEKPLEYKLLLALHQAIKSGNDTCGRFKTFSNRIMITSDSCSLLVRNASTDPVKQGRLRDILGALINGLDARAITIEAALTSARNAEMTQELFSVIRNAMIELGALFSDHERETINIMDDLMHHTQEGLSLLGLTEEQEEYFVTSIDRSMSRLIGLYTKGVQFDSHFQNILQLLAKLSAQL